MAEPPKTVWLSLALCDGEGQFKNGFALEAKSLSLHGLSGKDIVLDVVHLDGEQERMTFKAVEGRADWTIAFRLGDLPDYVAGMRMTGEFPANMPISKEEFRRRCGIGRILNEARHPSGGSLARGR